MDLTEKITQLEALLEADPDATGFFMLGKLYLDAENYAAAVEVLRRAIELKPDYSAAWKLAGDAWRKAGDKDKARETYRKGIEVADARGDLQTVREMTALLKKIEGA